MFSCGTSKATSQKSQANVTHSCAGRQKFAAFQLNSNSY